VVNRVARKNEAAAIEIVTAAAELMAVGGAGAVTLDAISRRADVAVQTIYNRVGNRSTVLLRVAERAFDANRAYLDAAYSTPGDPASRIRAVARAYARFAVEQPEEYRLLAFPGGDAATRARIDGLIDEQNARLASLLSEAVATGAARSDLDTTIAAVVLWRMWDGVLGLVTRHDRKQQPGAAPVEDVLATLETIVELGLRTRRASGGAAARG
jgi:AcrR family transcriptional regulator